MIEHIEIIYILIGIITGFLSGFFGIGGGSVGIPLLTLTGMSLLNSFATNMFLIPFASLSGAILQRRNIYKPAVLPFTLGAVSGIILATILVGVISDAILALLFMFSALVTIGGMYLENINKNISQKIKRKNINFFSFAFIGNIITGLRGGSGGTLFPALLSILHVPIHKAIATSLFSGFVASLFGLGIYIYRDQVLFTPAILLTIGGIAGAVLGSNISLHTKSNTLKISFSIAVLILAMIVVLKTFNFI